MWHDLRDVGFYQTRAGELKNLLLASFVLLSLLLSMLWAPDSPRRRRGISEVAPAIGEPVPNDYASHPHGALASSTEIYPTMVSPGGTLRVGFDDSNMVRLVLATDDRFATPEGISISSSLEDVLAVSDFPVVNNGNFGFTVLLPSGWIALFASRAGAPNDGSRVQSVFLR